MDARKLLAIRESLDAIWGATEKASDWAARYREDPDHPYEAADPRSTDWDAVGQEFASLLTTIARHRNDDKLWALIGEWAGEKA